LAGSGITDASLAQVGGLTGLETLDLRKTKVTAAGTHYIAAAYTSGDGNFAPSPLSSAVALTINKANLSYTIGNQSQTYGTPAVLANPTISTGVNGQTLVINESSLGDTATAHVGSYAITGTLANGTGSLSDYNVTLRNGTLTVNPVASIVLLDRTASGTLTDSGNGKISVGADSKIVVASTNATAVAVSGNGIVTASEFDIESSTGTQTSGNGKIKGAIDRGVAASEAADPLAGLAAPTASSTQFAAANISANSVVTLQPDTYNGGIQISGNAKVTLAAGIYNLNGGGFSAAGNAIVTGAGVLIYNAPQCLVNAINISGNASVTLSAATTGTYQGIVLFQSRTSAAPITIAGNASLILTGTLYSPAATVYASGNGLLDLMTAASELIAADMNVSGNGVVKVDA
jgi:hypothetical protein